MTQAFRIFQYMLSVSGLWLSRVVAVLLWPQKNLHTDRFATDDETQSLTHDTSFGLVLGVDRFGRTLSVEATKERPHLGHLAVFGPTGSGKTTRGEEQIRRWEGPLIVNDPKFVLSNATAALRKKSGKVYF